MDRGREGEKGWAVKVENFVTFSQGKSEPDSVVQVTIAAAPIHLGATIVAAHHKGQDYSQMQHSVWFILYYLYEACSMGVARILGGRVGEEEVA